MRKLRQDMRNMKRVHSEWVGRIRPRDWLPLDELLEQRGDGDGLLGKGVVGAEGEGSGEKDQGHQG